MKAAALALGNVSQRWLVVAKTHTLSNFSIHVNFGSRFPALISAIGHCFAAASQESPAHLEASFEDIKWQNKPAFTAWLEDVASAGKNGYAVDAGHHIGGVGDCFDRLEDRLHWGDAAPMGAAGRDHQRPLQGRGDPSMRPVAQL